MLDINVISLIVSAIFILIYIVYLSAQAWRKAIKSVLIILVLEGALRRWIIPQASDFVYFLKDIVFLGACFGFFSSCKEKLKLSYLRKLQNFQIAFLLILGGWFLFQTFNPKLGSPVLGLFGVKFYLFYCPLVWMTPYVFKDKEEFIQYLRKYLLLIIPICFLGVVQFFSPANSPLNTYLASEVGEDLGTATFSGSENVRITGTFSYIAGLATFLTYCFGILLPLIESGAINQSLIISAVEIILIISNTFMNGSRTILVSMIIWLGGYFVLQNPKNIVSFTQKVTPVVIVGLIALTVFPSATRFLQPALSSFESRLTGNDDLSGRTNTIFTQPLELTQFTGLDGYGVGAAHPAVTSLQVKLNFPPSEPLPNYKSGSHTERIEAEPGKVLLEIGPIGFLLWYGFRISLMFSLWRTYCRLKDKVLKKLALSAFLQHLALLPGMLIMNHVVQVYYWFLASFIFLLPQLEAKEHEKIAYQQYIHIQINRHN